MLSEQIFTTLWLVLTWYRRARLLDVEKKHSLHLCVIFFEWYRMWMARLRLFLEDFLHIWHRNKCCFICFKYSNLKLVSNTHFEHLWHSPLSVSGCSSSMCISTFLFSDDLKMHKVHLWRNPSCLIFLCFCSPPLLVWTELQISQANWGWWTNVIRAQFFFLEKTKVTFWAFVRFLHFMHWGDMCAQLKFFVTSKVTF